ncbi:hypothetical protein [Ralstonia phage RP13]|nr:hypothetical protein [Ralstonia phage RP13]
MSMVRGQFDILGNTGAPIDGCTQFLYKAFMISMSTMGRNHGACPTPILVLQRYTQTKVAEFVTVEDAIKWIDGDRSIDPYQVYDYDHFQNKLFEIQYQKRRDNESHEDDEDIRLYQVPGITRDDALVQFGKRFNDDDHPNEIIVTIISCNRVLG